MAHWISKCDFKGIAVCFLLLQLALLLYYISRTVDNSVQTKCEEESVELRNKITAVARENLELKQHLFQLEEYNHSNSNAVLQHSPPGQPAHVVYMEQTPLSAPVLQQMRQWLQDAGAPCTHRQDTNICPCISPQLKGKMLLNLGLTLKYTWKQVLHIAQTGDLTKGGKWTPSHCKSRWRLLIIIPYRDREQHLKAFLAHMHPILQRQLLEYRIIVVEQRLPTIFNKAAMMNIGYKEAQLRGFGPFDCVMFHDVDLLMEDDRNLIICGEKPVHYGVFIDKFNYIECCSSWIGGAVSMTWAQFSLINGFSNNFFGWGGEDNNIYNRLKKKKLEKIIPLPVIGRYSSLHHNTDEENSPNIGNMKYAYSDADFHQGLPTVNYNILDVKELSLYTWILADLNVTGLPYPSVSTSVMYSRVPGQCLQASTLYTHHVTTTKQCEDTCVQDNQCSAFVSYKDTSAHTVCEYKNGVCEQSSVPSNYTTYLKGVDVNLNSGDVVYRAYTVDCKGNDLEYYTLPSASDCANRCNNKSTCVGFVYAINVKKCYMKYKCEPPIYRLGKQLLQTYVKVR